MLRLPETMGPPADPVYAGLGRPLRLLPPPKVIEVTAADCWETDPVAKHGEYRFLSVAKHGFDMGGDVCFNSNKDYIGGKYAGCDMLPERPVVFANYYDAGVEANVLCAVPDMTDEQIDDALRHVYNTPHPGIMEALHREHIRRGKTARLERLRGGGDRERAIAYGLSDLSGLERRIAAHVGQCNFPLGPHE